MECYNDIAQGKTASFIAHLCVFIDHMKLMPRGSVKRSYIKWKVKLHGFL